MTHSDKKIKVLHISEAAGGVERYLVTLLRKLSGNREFEHVLVCPENFDTKKFSGIANACICIKELQHEIRPKQDIAAIRDIRKVIRDQNPDIVYFHSSKAGAVGRIADFGFKNIKIYNAHGWSFNMRSIGKMKRLFYVLVEKLLAPLADRIICISKYEKNSALENKICKANKLTVIRSGIELEQAELHTKQAETPAEKRSCREALGIPKDAVIVGTIGRLSEQKSPDTFVRVAKEISRNHDNVYFVMVGDGSLRDETQKLIDQMELSERFRITGWVDDPLEYAADFDVAVLLSRWEGFGLVLPEYMMMGKPIVATNADAIPEVVGKAGMIADVDDVDMITSKICEIIDHPKIGKKLVEEGSRRIKLFDAVHMAEKHSELFRRMVKRGKGK